MSFLSSFEEHDLTGMNSGAALLVGDAYSFSIHYGTTDIFVTEVS